MAGHISTGTRRGSFERVYDLTERVIPATVLAQATPPDGVAHRELIERAAAAHGVSTTGDLRDYFRLSPGETTAAIQALAEEGVLIPIEIPGWRHAWLHRDARRPRKIDAQALLAPFDPLIWSRDAPSGYSVFATELKSTFLLKNANTATTCCPYCWAIDSWRG